MNIKLLHTSELAALASKHKPHHAEGDTFLLCTIVDIVELAEQIKKSVNLAESDKVAYLLQTAHERVHYIIPLDADCLSENLFEHGDNDPGNDFWLPSVEIGTTPSRRVRRLLLRPRAGCFWDEELYNEMEFQFDATR